MLSKALELLRGRADKDFTDQGSNHNASIPAMEKEKILREVRRSHV